MEDCVEVTGETPRLRMFAGPNGSGKSTLKTVLPRRLLGTYINPDEIEASIRSKGCLDMAGFDIAPTTTAKLRRFLEGSRLLMRAGLSEDIQEIRCEGSRVFFGGVVINAYHASVLADFIRRALLEARRTFTLETVMSSTSKIDLLRQARAAGYRTYLYYIATESPEINISRVRNRVLEGGHDVPIDKIRSRYFRSLELLREAITLTDRAFLFDNSGHQESSVWIAEIVGGTQLEMQTDYAPAWFGRYVLRR